MCPEAKYLEHLEFMVLFIRRNPSVGSLQNLLKVNTVYKTMNVCMRTVQTFIGSDLKDADFSVGSLRGLTYINRRGFRC